MSQSWVDPGRAEGQPALPQIQGLTDKANIFVETGTGSAAMLNDVYGWFNWSYSIEFSDFMYAGSILRMMGTPNNTIIHGNSEDILGQVLDHVWDVHNTQRCVLFLDAHISDVNLAVQGQSVTAIVKEMEHWSYQVKKRGMTIYTLIDDARLFDGDAYPSSKWVEDYASSVGYTFELRDDVFRLMPDEDY